MTKYILHKANNRGHANHGWLDSFFSFSFAEYYDPERLGFGALRVINDDVIEGGNGFGMHQHKNMEIITIPLEGELKHQDSKGHSAIIKPGDIQVMSAGSGIYHSEYNANPDIPAKLLQIWIVPKVANVEPRYNDKNLSNFLEKNKIQQIVSPDEKDDGLWIHQDAWVNIANYDGGRDFKYDIKREGNGAYIFVIDGKIKVDGNILETRDAIGIWDTGEVKISAISGSRMVIFDVPL